MSGIGCTRCDGTQKGMPPKPAKVTRTYTQVGGRTIELGHLIVALASLCNEGELTDWEETFINDIASMYEERCKSVNWLSAAQLEQLERLYAKYF